MIDHTLAGLFGTVNLSNLFMGYKGMPRVFDVEAVIGAGWLHAFHGNEAAVQTAGTPRQVRMNCNS